jgi:hypothetical protein
MSDAVMLDFLVRTGIPAGLGVVIVLYLLRVIIPDMQRTFRDEMAATRKTFEDALKAEQQTHQNLMAQVTQTFQSEGQQTRATLSKLDRTASDLQASVYKLYGHSMTAFEASVSDGKKSQV